MLNLVKPNESVIVEILGTNFTLKAMGIVEREQWIYDSIELTRFNGLLEHLCKVIVKIDGYENPYETLAQLADPLDIKNIIEETIGHYKLSVDEEKNSDALSESATIANSTDAVKDADKVNESVSKVEQS